MFLAQKAGQQDRFKEVRNQYQKMLKHKKIYDTLKRLSPKFKWNVNVGCNREDEITRNWPLLRVILLTLTLNKNSRKNDRLYKLQPAAWTQSTFQLATGALS